MGFGKLHLASVRAVFGFGGMHNNARDSCFSKSALNPESAESGFINNKVNSVVIALVKVFIKFIR